ncbi:hypothetical protein [Rhizobium sp. 9140]|nr:hypothetical protein [Rhizobium sp. 9140]
MGHLRRAVVVALCSDEQHDLGVSSEPAAASVSEEMVDDVLL